MKLLAILAALVVGYVAVPAHAGESRFEALGGGCNWTAVGDGIWYNEKYDHALDLTSNCGFIGVSKVSDGHGWRIGYTSLGTARAMSVYPIVDHEQAYPAFDGRQCDYAKSPSGCLARGYASQTAEGISVGYILEFPVGKVMLGAEGGLFVYDGSFNVQLHPEPAGQYGRPAWYDLHWRGIQVTPFVGFTARYEYLFAMYRTYGNVRAAEHGCGGCSGLAGGPLAQVLIGVSVPF